MTLFDIILLLILFGFILYGAFFGFIQALGSLLGVVIGTWVAGLYYETVAAWISPFLPGQEMWANVIAFILILILVNRIVGLAFHLIGKVFNIVSIIPFLKSINRLLGAVLGLIEGVVVIGLVIYLLSQFDVSPWLNNLFMQSNVASYFVNAIAIVKPLIPDAIKTLQGYYESINVQELMEKGEQVKEIIE